MGTSIGVVIPTFRRGAKLLELVKSLFVATRPPDEVIVVDNDPALSCQESWSKQWPVRILHAGLGLNVSGARNIGWRAANTDLCVFIDDDNIVAPHTLEVLCEAASLTDVGMAAPVIYEVERPAIIWCAGVKRSMWTTRTRFMHRGMTELPKGSTWLTDDMPDAFAIPKSVLALVGGFDEVHFPFHYEEADLGERIRKVGLRIVVVRDALVWHSGGVDANPGVEMFRCFELGGDARVELMSYARVCFHRRHSPLIQKMGALALFVPIWAILVLIACLRQPKAWSEKQRVAKALLKGLARGYSAKIASTSTSNRAA